MTTHSSELSDEQIDKMISDSSVPFVSYGDDYWDVDGLVRKVDLRELARALRQETTSAAVPAESMTLLPDKVMMRMRSAGRMLSNCAYNLAQTKGEPLSERAAQTLDECRREWDGAMDDLREAINNSPNIPIAEAPPEPTGRFDHVECQECGNYYFCERCGGIEPEIVYSPVATPITPAAAPREDFETWWERSGQFSRAGGGGYEKTFAFNAWHAALASNPTSSGASPSSEAPDRMTDKAQPASFKPELRAAYREGWNDCRDAIRASTATPATLTDERLGEIIDLVTVNAYDPIYALNVYGDVLKICRLVEAECRASSGEGNVAASSVPPTPDQSTRNTQGSGS